MAHRLGRLAIAAGLWAVSGAALASGDGGCDTSWKLFTKTRDCASRAMLVPGNDSRVNLLFLMRERSGVGLKGLSISDEQWGEEGFGRAFLTWRMLRRSIAPAGQDEDDSSYSGSRCASLSSAAPEFTAALDASGVPGGEKTKLIAARSRLAQVCAGGVEAEAAARRRMWSSDTLATQPPTLAGWPDGIASAPGRAFLSYLQASDAFYAERWDEARTGFASITGAKQAWVAETAAYMVARVELNAAIAHAFDEYGYFDGLSDQDRPAAMQAGTALAAYLKRYPKGRYAASAHGLQRRVYWLTGNSAALAQEYDHMLDAAPGNNLYSAQLVEEIDNKLLFPQSQAATADAHGAWLLATQDLVRMRDERSDGETAGGPGLSASALEAQRPSFAGLPELFGFLLAAHAFYVAHDWKRVLTLVPDDARRQSYAPLAFSRQVLRGMALAALGDRNEVGFWRELLGGADPLWQRPTVELALAMNLERRGQVAQVFAQGSPITDSDIRMILLSHSAGPQILREQAVNGSRPAVERSVALYTLLNKQLSRGEYTQFLTSLKIPAPAAADPQANWTPALNAVEQVRSFKTGTWSDVYSCPALADTARKLAANPRDVSARLCLGDFWRLNGFDPYRYDDSLPAKDELGGAADEFPGKSIARGEIYAAVMADPAAGTIDKAYALYRAINCYGPSGYNGCGGADVPQAQRRAWFQRLKREFAGTKWAAQQEYYW